MKKIVTELTFVDFIIVTGLLLNTFDRNNQQNQPFEDDE